MEWFTSMRERVYECEFLQVMEVFTSGGESEENWIGNAHCEELPAMGILEEFIEEGMFGGCVRAGVFPWVRFP